MKESGLRFAPLIRVSTEKQERQGESLSTQRKQLGQAIKNLNGTVYKWYAGQEHATPDNERKILEELMADAQAGKFDAVMVADISRWSRDNQKSKKHLAILKENDIQFYWLGRNMDLTVPFNNLMIGMGTEINEFFAAEQAYKSLINKIELAKKGIPCSGQIPYGRTYDKPTNQWGIDTEKQKILKDAASRYINGEGLKTIAAFYKMNLPNLHVLLKEKAGDTWDLHFNSEQFNIDETITLKIPRLLPQATIDVIKKRSAANRTYMHGQTKHNYLLARMIFCDECGYSLYGQANRNGSLYYRHAKNNGCKHPFNAAAPMIETRVIADIFRMFGDRPKMEQAAQNAIGNKAETEASYLTIQQGDKRLTKIKRAKDNVLQQVAEGFLKGVEVKQMMEKLKESETNILAEMDKAKTKLQNIPSQADIKAKSGLLLRLTKNILRSHKHLSQMTFDDKRKLLQSVFDGKDKDGKRLGIYLAKNKIGDQIYTINGIMGISLTDYVKSLSSESTDYMVEEDDDIKKDSKVKSDKENLSGLNQANA
jgi:site-specific DNA recombinase